MKRVLWSVLSAAILVSPALPASAQSTEPGRESSPALAAPEPVENWGPGATALMLGMSQFGARNGASNWTYGGVGYVSRAAGTDLIWAAVHLPNGAVLDGADAFFNDSSTTSDGRMLLTRFFGTNSFEDIANAATSGNPGFVTISLNTDRVIDNTNNIYVVYLDMAIDAALTCKGVRVRYHLQTSAAPATATFTDVPTGHPFFRWVEALAASGITGGCGGTNFCPDDAVTRGQMAVFLSTALGLHFPY